MVLLDEPFASLDAHLRASVRADVQEIALRLERCFDEPFAVEGVILHPAASVGIALYPEDATTKDGILNSADAAMYKAKNAKRQIAEMLADDPDRQAHS